MNLLLALRIGDFRQPIAEPVWLKAPFLSRRAACRREICLTMPRWIISAAISRPLHWLIGRTDLTGWGFAREQRYLASLFRAAA